MRDSNLAFLRVISDIGRLRTEMI